MTTTTINIKTLADLKRALTFGTKLETLSLAHGVKGGRLSVGQIRRVVKADTTGVYIATDGDDFRGSYLGFGKASQWTFNGDTFTSVFGMSYKIVGA